MALPMYMRVEQQPLGRARGSSCRKPSGAAQRAAAGLQARQCSGAAAQAARTAILQRAGVDGARVPEQIPTRRQRRGGVPPRSALGGSESGRTQAPLKLNPIAHTKCMVKLGEQKVSQSTSMSTSYFSTWPVAGGANDDHPVSVSSSNATAATRMGHSIRTKRAVNSSEHGGACCSTNISRRALLNTPTPPAAPRAARVGATP
jgi:hypothetical protein